jgi:hypothetical protein
VKPAQDDWKAGTEESEKQRKTREFHEHFRNQYDLEKTLRAEVGGAGNSYMTMCRCPACRNTQRADAAWCSDCGEILDPVDWRSRFNPSAEAVSSYPSSEPARVPPESEVPMKGT